MFTLRARVCVCMYVYYIYTHTHTHMSLHHEVLKCNMRREQEGTGEIKYPGQTKTSTAAFRLTDGSVKARGRKP